MSVAARPRTPDGVIVAVDPHKASWTAVVVDAGLTPVAALRVASSRAGYRQLRRFTVAWPHVRWAVEGAAGLGAPLTERLRTDEIAVIDVPAKLARRVRLLSTGHGRKATRPAHCRSVSPLGRLPRYARWRSTRPSRRCAP